MLPLTPRWSNNNFTRRIFGPSGLCLRSSKNKSASNAWIIDLANTNSEDGNPYASLASLTASDIDANANADNAINAYPNSSDFGILERCPICSGNDSSSIGDIKGKDSSSSRASRRSRETCAGVFIRVFKRLGIAPTLLKRFKMIQWVEVTQASIHLVCSSKPHKWNTA